ncbi:MAG: hypothetical protein C4570_06270 [Ammonifex sp.]|nr:MAG: hypothetical protein C4570_06270 [Ammonifex sp.]
MSQLPEIIREFLRYLRVEKNASPLTLAAYRSDLKPLEEFFLIENVPLELAGLTTPVLRRYFIWLQERRGLHPASLRRKINCFRSFFHFVVEQEYLAHDPMRKIKPPPKPDRVPVFLRYVG